MAGTRSSARVAGRQSDATAQDKTSNTGDKRKANGSDSKAGAKAQKKEQKSIEDTLPADGQETKQVAAENKDDAKQEVDKDHKSNGNQEHETKEEPASPGGAVVKDKERGNELPSNLIERGLIYFFVRGRVGIEEPNGVQDIARSHLVLRPIPDDAKLGQGSMDDLKTSRLIALPKKVLPKSHRDVFMAFVEKAKTNVQDMKDNFLPGSDYETKTTGVRHTPAVTPIGEGVYSITEMGRNSRLAYMLTLPEKLGQVQKSMGLADKGSFVISVKNPEQKGPPQASLPQGPAYPQEIKDEFRGLRWLGNVQPKHLDYDNAQSLMIGEGVGDLGKAAQATEEDEKSNKKETPEEEMEKLEAEDHQRVEALNGEHAIYKDLAIRKSDYPDLKTTW